MIKCRIRIQGYDTNCVCEKIGIYQILNAGGHETSLPVKLWCDNQVAPYCINFVFDEQTKHIQIGRHFICEKVQQGLISTVKTGGQLEDIFTKALNGGRVDYLCNKLGMLNIYALTWEGVLML